MKGIYVLLISLSKDAKLHIGSLGVIAFRKGLYAYVGSAQNSIDKRVARHFSRRKKKFWHIDYLLSSKHAKILAVYFKIASKKEECQIARLLSKQELFVPGFGCSDCACCSHLFIVRNQKIFSRFGLKLMKSPHS